MADTTNKIRIRARVDGNLISVKALIKHPMETGRRKDKQGNLVPAHFIQHIYAEYRNKRVFNAYWGTGVSKDPFIAFVFEKSGNTKRETVTLSWVDNLGLSGNAEASIG